MAAATPSPDNLLPQIIPLLRTATDICVFAWYVHKEDDDVAQVDTPLEFRRLAALVSGAAAKLLEAVRDNPQPENTLHKTCDIVARNLTIRLDRTLEACDFGKNDQLDRTVFCSSWTLDDIKALGARLSQVLERVEGLHTEFTDSSFAELKRCRPRLRHIVVDDSRSSKEVLPKEPPKPVTKSLPSHIEELMRASQEGLKGLHTKKIPKENSRTGAPTILNDFILDSLAYKSMHDREDEVTRAHGNTLEWIFSPTKETSDLATGLSHRFDQWLTSDKLGTTFWITGKPGSGKSTFMQFLYQHDLATERLKQWAGDKPVLRVGFFFWTSGSRDQRSLTGLLRYLLHQMLTACPEYMPDTFPGLWDKLGKMSTKERIQLALDWTAPELHRAFGAFMDAALKQRKVCFFIDGMDEFEGDHQTIITFFRELGKRNEGRDVKMCLSSRPWEVFEQAFEHRVPTMKLQDVTFGDMQTYVTDRLVGDKGMKGSVGKTLATLAENIVRQADGVFLWARLAVNQLFEAFRGNPKGFEASSTLASLPTDLYQLFDKLIFQDQTDAEISETSVLFQLIKAREDVADFVRNEEAHSLSIWEYTFALSKDLIPTEVTEVPDERVIEWCGKTMKILHHRFSQLVEPHEKRARGNVRTRFDLGTSQADFYRRFADNRVTFIHRTVRDWLMYEPGVKETLLQHSPASYDPHLQLLRSYILRLKNPLEEPEHHRRLDEWYPDIVLAMTHARYVEVDPDHLQRSFLNEMNDTLSWYWLRKPKDPYDHWARNAFGQFEVRMKAAPIFQPFLCLAAKFQLTRYLSEELEAIFAGELSGTEDDKAVPLLAYATEFLCSRKKTVFPVTDPALISFLLRNEEKRNPGPNHEYSEFTFRYSITPWLALLKHLRDAKRRRWIEYYDDSEEGVERWIEVLNMFLKAGADANAVVEKDMWDPEVTALEVLELLDDTYGDFRIAEAKETLKKAMK